MNEDEIIDVRPSPTTPSAMPGVEIGHQDIPNNDRPTDGKEIPADEEKPAKPVDGKVIPPYAITFDNYQEGMSRGVFEMEAGLMSEAGYVYERMAKTRKTASELDDYLLDKEKLKELSPQDKMELYKVVNKSLAEDSSYLLGLHNALPLTDEILRSALPLEEPMSLEDKETKRAIEALLLEQIKWVVKEKQKLPGKQKEESIKNDGNPEKNQGTGLIAHSSLLKKRGSSGGRG